MAGKKNVGGRPRWAPKNPEHARRLVESLASFGHTHAVIAAMMDPPCSPNTLVSHFRAELDMAAEMFKARVEATFARMALGVPEIRIGKKVVQKEVPPDKTMMIFLLKSRYGYRDSQRHEITGLESLNLENLTDAQLDQLTKRISGKLTALDRVGAEEETEPTVEKVH